MPKPPLLALHSFFRHFYCVPRVSENMRNHDFLKAISLVALAVFLAGCSSVAQGVTEAVLEHHDKKEDTRRCEIEGKAFDGVRASLDAQIPGAEKAAKILMVHGISSHFPGYSNRFKKKLLDKLGLTVSDAQIKTISLQTESIRWKKDDMRTLGTLRVTRHMNEDRTKQLIFYELTWSPIVEAQKREIQKDSSNDEGLARADFNRSLKAFLNETVPDLLIYNGNGYRKITESVAQSVCWMLADTWHSLPKSGAHICAKWPQSNFRNLAQDDHFFVTHSLGSRITVDTIQNFASPTLNEKGASIAERVRDTVRNKEFTVFMLANQLPLLQMGRDAPEISGQMDSFCIPGGKGYGRRVMNKMNIVAFSDPNDILSYPVPRDFAKNQLDSRICPSVANVSLNIAEQKGVFDAVSFANPLSAHRGYLEDDRVIETIANGVHRGDGPVVISGRCRWLEIVDY